jgi:hypothetical protein
MAQKLDRGLACLRIKGVDKTCAEQLNAHPSPLCKTLDPSPPEVTATPMAEIATTKDENSV